MTSNTPKDSFTVTVNGQPVSVNEDTPTCRQILLDAGYSPVTEYILINCPDHGPTKSLEPDDRLKDKDEEKFKKLYAFKEDAVFFFTFNELRFAWKQHLSGKELREIAHISENYDVFFDRAEVKDQLVDDNAHINLERDGVERFYAKEKCWKLDIQGEIYEFNIPVITVREALVKAGYDIGKPWIITLKIADKPKELVTLDAEIDLRTPGIERLRVLKGQVSNGEGTPVRRQFNLMPKDDSYLEGQNYCWETVLNDGRWLIVKNYKLPAGYNHDHCTLAVQIPQNYPASQLDMFFCHPSLSRNDGITIPQTQVIQTIDERSFQRWSRHPTSPWMADDDYTRTHFALIDESISREVEK
jgi:hypothetical protein